MMRKTSNILGTTFVSGLLGGQIHSRELIDTFCVGEVMDGTKKLSGGVADKSSSTTAKTISTFNVDQQAIDKLSAVDGFDNTTAAIADVVKRYLTTPLIMQCATSNNLKQQLLADVGALAFGSPERTESVSSESSSTLVVSKDGKRISGTKRLTIGNNKLSGSALKYAVVFGEIRNEEGVATSVGCFIVNLTQGKGVKVSSSSSSGPDSFFVEATFDNAEATELKLPAATTDAAEATGEDAVATTTSASAASSSGDMHDASDLLLGRSRVATAAVALASMRQLLEVATLHSTARRTRGKLLCDQQSIQGKLAFLEMHNYALESFIEFVNKTPSTDGEAVNTTEAALLHFFAMTHLKKAIQLTLDVVHPQGTNGWTADLEIENLVVQPEVKAPENTGATTDADSSTAISTETNKVKKYKAIKVAYSKLKDIEANYNALSELSSFNSEVVGSYFAPQLKIAAESPAAKKTAVVGRLSATHINLEPSLKSLETDISTFPSVCAKHTKSLAKRTVIEQKLINNSLAAYLSELVASSAVAYRATNALDIGSSEEEITNKEWLNAGSFLGFSASNRSKLVRKMNFIEVAGLKKPKNVETLFDAIHPMELPKGAPAAAKKAKTVAAPAAAAADETAAPDAKKE